MSFARHVKGAGLSTCVAVGVQSLLVGTASAADFEYRASLGAGHSDNIRRVETNEEDEDIASAGLQFSFDQDTAKLRADVFGDVAYNDYRNDTFESEVVGNVRADLLYSFVPQRFERRGAGPQRSRLIQIKAGFEKTAGADIRFSRFIFSGSSRCAPRRRRRRRKGFRSPL